jgi:alanine racemase
MRLALLPVGYADGFRREASSGVGDGWVMVGGKRAAVAGRVSMNLTTVDVTGFVVEVGDEVVLLGEGVTAEDHAGWCGTIAYEILCGVRSRMELQ